jgi:hypothetical protein
VVDQRILSTNTPVTEKFLSNDNEIDTLNQCYAVINNLVSTIRLQNNEYGVELLSVNNVSPILFKELDLVDGWICNLTLAIPNDILSVC